MTSCPHTAVCSAAGSAVNELSFQSKIDSDLLVLDVGTMRFRPGRPPGPATASAEECAGFCRITTGCNAWSYCHNPYGCGTGCLSYVASHPACKSVRHVHPASDVGGTDTAHGLLYTLLT